MLRRKISLILCSGIALYVSLVATPVRAANITVQGAFGADDSIQRFNFTVATPGLVDIRTYGYAGGVPSNGSPVPGGGFDGVLTLFDSGGVFINDNDMGSGVATDPTTGLAEDARLLASLTPGAYILVLTQYDNFSLGNLVAGFVQTGHPHFTADASFSSGGACPGDVFRDISGTAGRCRTGNWTVDFLNVSSAAAVPEPSALLLTALGLALCIAVRGWRLQGVRQLLGVVFALGAASAQTHSDPDFSTVSDYLNGKRSLLKITDMQVVSLWDLSSPALSTITTSNSQQTGSERSDSLGFIDASKPLRPFSARMFNQPGNITITPFYDFRHTALLTLWLNNVAGLPSKTATWTPFTAGDEPTFTAGAVADFTLDGFEELALTFQDGRMLIIVPNDVNDISKGYRKSVGKLDVLGDLVAGDFDGDGKRELAGLSVLPNGGLQLIIYTVDPDTLTVGRASSLILTTPGTSAGTPVTALSMARGRFNNAAHDQLAVTFSTSAGPGFVEVVDFEVNKLTPIEKPQLTAAATSIPVGYLQVKTGQFGLPKNGYDQIVFHSSSTSANGRFFSIVSVDPVSLKAIGGHAGVGYNQVPCSAGLQVGNFDHRQPDSTTPGATVPNLNSQIAFLYCNGTTDSFGQLGFTMNIYSVNPDTFDIQGNPESAISLANTYGIAFVESDLQGRSVTLGEPTLITMSSTVQPSVVIGAPPMHIDFVSPSPGSNVPAQVLNLSAVPDGFKTTYTQSTTDGSTSSTTGTTSWSWGAKETISASVTIGDVDADAFTAGDTFSAAQDLKGSTDTVTGQFSSKTFKLSDTTGYGDEVSFIDTPFNVWVYPVIGKTVCPKSKPTCQVNEQVPVTIQFSAPLKNQPPEAAQGQTLQWYQPPWEPGNIFSYPATLQQLLTIYPTLSTLATGSGFLTDASTITQSTQWDVGNKDGGTTSFNQNYSFDNDYSATGDIGEKGVAQAKISGDIDINGSVGFSNLTKTTTTLATSTGLETSKPGAFPSPDLYAYSVTPYIMGTTVPGGVVDNKPLRADVTTFGVLRALYTADPLATNAGKWWKQAYGQAPDVALNHPARWVINTPALSNPLPNNCLAGTGEANCAELGQRIPSNPWLSEFHYMRGFFISSALSPGQGPQLEHAKNSDVLTLQARVYNYSLKKMPDGSTVHVRFYFAPWGETAATGDSVLIGESVLPPISPFSDLDGAPLNWTLASTTFDISKYPETKAGNVSVAFWVVVWMQDSNNQLVGEMPGHGLTAIPGVLKSLADVAEECQPDGNCYSNNVGFFPQAFYIDAPSLAAVQGPSLRTTMNISKVELSASQTTPGRAVVVSASLLSSLGPASGISANFYDGDPNNKGRLINVQRVPHINANHQHGVQALFRTNTCGVHQIFVVVNKGTSSEVIRRAAPLRVNCPVR